MAFGIALSNANGSIIISDSLKNMQYIGLATNTTNTLTSGNFGGQLASLRNVMLHYFQISTSEIPMCFVRGSPSSYFAIVSHRQLNASTWEIVVASYPTSTPQLLCFAPIPVGSGLANPVDFGLAVYDAAGNLAYDSARKHLDPAYFNVLNTPACSPVNSGGVGGACAGTGSISTGIAVPAPAFFFAPRGRAWVSAYNTLAWLQMARLSALGETVEMAWNSFSYNANGGSTTQWGVEPSTMIVVDAARYL